MPSDRIAEVAQVEEPLAESKAVWQRPGLKRFAASDAETADTVSGEGGSGLS